MFQILSLADVHMNVFLAECSDYSQHVLLCISEVIPALNQLLKGILEVLIKDCVNEGVDE